MPHGYEIERKFLVLKDKLPPLENVPHDAIVQGYLTEEPYSVRVRLIGRVDPHRNGFHPPYPVENRGELTVKGKGTVKRREVNVPMLPSAARELLELATAKLTKTRYYLSNGWTLDHIVGLNKRPEGSELWLAEIELPSEQHQYTMQEWLGDEVTEDRRYTNQELAKLA